MADNAHTPAGSVSENGSRPTFLRSNFTVIRHTRLLPEGKANEFKQETKQSIINQ